MAEKFDMDIYKKALEKGYYEPEVKEPYSPALISPDEILRGRRDGCK